MDTNDQVVDDEFTLTLTDTVDNSYPVGPLPTFRIINDSIVTPARTNAYTPITF